MGENMFDYDWLIEVSKDWNCIPGGSLSVYGVEVCKSRYTQRFSV